MNNNKNRWALVVALTIISQAQAGTVTSDGADIVIKTKGGFEAKTTDGIYSFKLGGRIQLDYNDFDGVINDIEGKSGDDLFFRRARLELKGKAQDWGYVASYNLTDGGSIDKLNMTYLAWGKMAKLTLGQQKEFFGLEDTTSSKWITAVERSMPSSAFDTGDNVGIKLHGANDMWTYSVGVYKENIDSDDNSLDTAMTGRVVFRPIYADGNLLHLGVGFTSRDGIFDGIDARLGVRGGEDGDLVNRVEADYDGAEGDEFEAYNVELAGIMGPFHFEAEFFDGEISGPSSVPDLDADGYSVQGAWIFTGESRSYKTGIGAFDKVKPSDSDGAWEVFLRYDTLDVSNSSAGITVTGEEAETLTLGVNWYMTSHVKIALNYVDAETDKPINNEDDGDAIVGRLQFSF